MMIAETVAGTFFNRSLGETGCLAMWQWTHSIGSDGALEFDLPGNGSNPASFERMEANHPEPEYLTEPEIRRRERENLFAVLQKAGWKIKGADGAAELLGVKPSTLISRIAKMGLKRAEISEKQNVGAAF
jgi:transcriptional regulator with GAF, ATPase, and Fis domain